MSDKYKWLLKKSNRSVDQLRLWGENPRLNPEESHLTLRDFAEDLTVEAPDRKDFYDLITSITQDGFIPADPVVIWKNTTNNKYYVAEGNRRVVALKLLRDPQKAPKGIRSFVRKASEKIDHSTIEKIPVNIAPSFEEAEWYINQRNSSSSLQRRWSRVQQQRWIVTLYEKHQGNLDKILSITKLTKSELEGFFRILKIKDLVKETQVKEKLSDDEFERANSYRFPITILERFFNFSEVREKWGIRFEGVNIEIVSNKSSFYNAFSELIKRIIIEDDKDPRKINTRFKSVDLEDMLASLPAVFFDNQDESFNEEEGGVNEGSSDEGQNTTNENNSNEDDSSSTDTGTQEEPINPVTSLKGDPNRNRMILDIYELNTDSYRLLGLFNELKKIPLAYKNSISAALRVFLDLAVLKYIESEGLENALKSQYNSELRSIQLKKRLEYIKVSQLSGKPQTIVNRLIDPNHQYSLDVLNGYIHGQDTHYLNKQFLNGFWDFLFPLFEVLLEIQEN